MSAKNYNSFPEAPELLRKLDGEWLVIRRKQELSQILANEVNERLTPELDNFRSDVS
jgi:diaminopimelate decarboxylase